MLGRARKTAFSNDGTVREWYQQRCGRSRMRAHGWADVERIHDLKWEWRCACERTDLSRFIFTASGVTRAVPLITDIDLGPPVALTVRVGPGQSPADFVDAAPVIARAMNVGSVDVVRIRPHWLVRIVLRPEPLAAVSG